MDFFNTITSFITIPDLFKVAGDSWGIETVCLCLIPIFISSMLTIVLVVQVFQIPELYGLKKIKQIKIGLLSALFIFLILQLIQWKRLLDFAEQPLTSTLFTYLLLGGVFIFSIIWILLITLLWNNFPRVKFYMLPSLLYGLSALYFIWQTTRAEEIGGFVLILSGSLLSISLALIATLLSQVNNKQSL